MIALVMMLGFGACIEEYNPEISSYQDLLVVDGGITNEEGPHIIRLSLSSSLAEPTFTPVSGAGVQILDDAGAVISLQETEAGIYATEAGMKGVIGRSYRVLINIPGGETYASDFELLQAPVAIDTVYHQVVTRQDPGYMYDLWGYEFFVDTKEADYAECYLKWDVEATYQYQSDFTIRWYFDGELHWFHGPDSLFNCWTTNPINTIYASSTNALTQPVIKGYPLNFVSTETRQLSVRYSLLVKQRTLSEKAFEYWDEVRTQNGGEWTLYAIQPHFIRGNVYNQNDASEQVLGYFMVSSVDRMRVFVDRPGPEIPMRYHVCKLTQADFEAYGDMWMMDPVMYPLYAIETNGGRRALPHQDCVDCRRKGGTIEKPDFWIDP